MVVASSKAGDPITADDLVSIKFKIKFPKLCIWKNFNHCSAPAFETSFFIVEEFNLFLKLLL